MIKDNINYLAEKKVLEFKKNKEEKENLIETCKKIIEEYKEKIYNYENDIKKNQERLKEELFNLIPNNEFRETNTQFKYCIPSGDIIRKKAYKDVKLKEFIEDKDIPIEYLKIKKTIDWINFKKKLEIQNESVINKDTGEIINIVEIVSNPESFKITIK
jgi:hypothetical protein